MVLFSIQFSFSLIAYSLIAAWYVVPRLSRWPRETALQPLLWVHAFRVAGGAVLAPGAVATAVPIAFQRLVGYGDLITAGPGPLAPGAPRAPPARGPTLAPAGPLGGGGGPKRPVPPAAGPTGVQPRAGR